MNTNYVNRYFNDADKVELIQHAISQMKPFLKESMYKKANVTMIIPPVTTMESVQKSLETVLISLEKAIEKNELEEADVKHLKSKLTTSYKTN